MLAVFSPPEEESPTERSAAPVGQVMLASGQHASLEGMSGAELHELQWEQEQRFARAILAYAKGSPQRAMITGQAYDTICTILAA